MARDKLITIRIEGDKRQAFGDLAKSQNTDTASLLYDFISGCLDGRIDISLVTGKGNRIDNQLDKIDSDRIDKLEATTQRIDERVGQISKKLTDWIEAIDDRITDSDQGLSKKMISLEHRLNALASQLDSQRLDSIDTDSQRIDDMEQLLKREREASIATSPLPPSPDEPVRPGTAIGTLPTVETVEPISSIETVASAIEDPEKKIMEPVGGSDSLDTLPVPPITDKTIDQNAIETVPGETDSIEPVTGEAVNIGDKPWYTIDDLLDRHYPGWPKTKEGLRKKALTECWPRRMRRSSKGNPYEYQAILPE